MNDKELMSKLIGSCATDDEVFAATNLLARAFYEGDAPEDHVFKDSEDFRGMDAWRAAVKAVKLMTPYDPENLAPSYQTPEWWIARLPLKPHSNKRDFSKLADALSVPHPSTPGGLGERRRRAEIAVAMIPAYDPFAE